MFFELWTPLKNIFNNFLQNNENYLLFRTYNLVDDFTYGGQRSGEAKEIDR
ncbi:hypothetical protein ADICYQ_4774 [Cyclobacterium qasimii M12-11B]|uniref:Uncharacterized protein n=1 Tax=Cyclobacterium qasimii M12-11B TaxID=641524 RepID=S7V818_9BACT|nr:hypothetical protein ADICYQ_4774 [Cyclobacterium qasimii M12-11B]